MVSDSNSRLQQKLASKVRHLLKAFDEVVQEKFKVVDTAMLGIQRQMAELERQNRVLFAVLASIKQEGSGTFDRATTIRTTDTFDRKTDPGTLVVSCN